MVRIWSRMLRIPFEWLELGFESFESLSNGWKLDSNASNPFQIVRIWSRMFRIPFEWLELGIKCFESLSNG